jgi:DNA-binding MarR family transcriptional regulator
MKREIQLMELFNQINREILKRLLPIFREKNLSVVELSVLMRMNRQQICSATELARMVGIPTSTVTGILDRLEQRGLLERKQDPNDRRSIQVRATAKTKDYIAELMTPMEDMLQAAFSSLPSSRTRGLLRDLRFILQTLERKTPAQTLPADNLPSDSTMHKRE